MRIATWNVNSLRVHFEHVRRWVGIAKPDVMCLQETKVEDDEFPVLEMTALGYPHLAFWGEKTYNGVAIASKEPLADVQRGFSEGAPDDQPRLVAATVSGIRVMSCYVPMGTQVGTDKFSYKLAFYSRLKTEVRAALAKHPDLVLCGDLNVALTDLDVWDPFEREGQVLFHPTERDALRRVIDAGFVDAWRTKNPKAPEFSWWDYRSMAWSRNQGLRIDYTLVSKALAPKITDAAMWKEARGWNEPSKPSDHVPVTVDLAA